MSKESIVILKKNYISDNQFLFISLQSPIIKMLEDTKIPCPACGSEISAKSLTVGKKVSYVVSDDCPHCNMEASKIETLLNKSGKGQRWRVEKSYIKLDPRG